MLHRLVRKHMSYHHYHVHPVFTTFIHTNILYLCCHDGPPTHTGPGGYKLPSGLCGKGKGYPYRAAPIVSMSGREKFGSPW